MAKKSKGKSASGAKGPPADEYVLKTLEQVRALSDPLRVSLVAAFCEERTTMQAAERMGEPATKLYHHVDALERAGLIRMTRTRPKRGTLEKYYSAVARRFRADPQLFAVGDGPSGSGGVADVVTAMLGSTAEEMRALCAAVEPDEVQDEGLLSFVELRADDDFVRKLRRRLMRLLNDLQKHDEEDADTEGLRRFRLTLAYFPLDRTDRS